MITNEGFDIELQNLSIYINYNARIGQDRRRLLQGNQTTVDGSHADTCGNAGNETVCDGSAPEVRRLRAVYYTVVTRLITL